MLCCVSLSCFESFRRVYSRYLSGLAASIYTCARTPQTAYARSVGRVGATLVVAAALVGICGSAQAADPLALPAGRGVHASPAFAGDRLVYVTTRVVSRAPYTWADTVRAVAPGAQPRPLDAWNAKVGRRSAAVSASGDRLLLATAEPYCEEADDCQTKETSYYAGTVDGRPKLIQRCHTRSFFGRGDELAVSGDWAAHFGCGHKYVTAPVVLRDLAHASAPPRTLRAPAPWDGFDSIRLAGRFLAARASSQYLIYDEDSRDRQNLVVVYDVVTGAELYRVEGATQGYDIQADGKLVVTQHDPDLNAYGSGNCVSPVLPITWFSPSEPYAHRLPYSTCQPGIAIARDRIAWHARSAVSYGQLMLTDVGGAAPMPLSGPGLPRRFAFDGERIAYSQARCLGAEIIVDDVTRALAAGPRRPESCAVHFAGQVRQTRDGALLIPVRCRRGCAGFWDVTLAGHKHSFYGLSFEISRRAQKRTLVIRGGLVYRTDPPESIVRKRMIVSLGVFKTDGTQTTVERQAIRARVARHRAISARR
jgi:hypothetical protein